MVVRSILVKMGVRSSGHTLCQKEDVNLSRITAASASTADASPTTRKGGPPPLKSGSTYINPGEEDQMVRRMNMSYENDPRLTRCRAGDHRVPTQLDPHLLHLVRHCLDTRWPASGVPLEETLDARVYPRQGSSFSLRSRAPGGASAAFGACMRSPPHAPASCNRTTSTRFMWKRCRCCPVPRHQIARS